MVELKGKSVALGRLVRSFGRLGILAVASIVVLAILYGSCTARVGPNEWGVEQARFGSKSGIVEKSYGPGLYFVGPGTTMHTFPREIQVLEASTEREESKKRAGRGDLVRSVETWFAARDKLLGSDTHRTVDALSVQTSDGYAVIADVTILYSIVDPVKVAKDFGWGTTYVDSFVLNTFRNGVMSTLGKMAAEDFYGETARTAALAEAEALLRARFAERGFRVDALLIRNYRYSENYERALQEKKVAVQLTEKNIKESLVNEERAKLDQAEAKGNATITIADSLVNADIARVKAEAALYSAEVRAQADKEYGLAGAEGKRLKADALTQSGGRYVVALETAKMFENIEAAAMTPDQYVKFIRDTWALIGLGGGGR